MNLNTSPSPSPNHDDPNFLQTDRETRFRFMIQLQANPYTLPLDKATVRWSETTSPLPSHAAKEHPTAIAACETQLTRVRRAYLRRYTRYY